MQTKTPMPLYVEYQMSALKALRQLRLHNRLPRQDVRQLRSLWNAGKETPKRLEYLTELVFLVQTKPYSNLMH